MLHNKTILVTGGTGSWGHELVSQILSKYKDVKEVRVYSRGEHKQVDMAREFGYNQKLKFIIGDIRDKTILSYAMSGVDVVFHLAALKHVPVCEQNTWEAVLTNIVGAQNVIEAAIANKVEMVVDVSTDKAVEPFNLYGITKACGEKLMINSNYNYTHVHHGKTKFICIRGGNVIGTNGSVIPLFKKQIEEQNEITITDPTMTRFLMSTKEAIGLIFTAVEHSVGGELFVLRMPSATLETIAHVMIRLFGNPKTKITVCGIRPGEKLHESLVSKNEVPFTRIFSSEYFMILPQIESEVLEKHYAKYRRADFLEFTSQTTERLNSADLTKILKAERWLWNN